MRQLVNQNGAFSTSNGQYPPEVGKGASMATTAKEDKTHQTESLMEAVVLKFC